MAKHNYARPEMANSGGRDIWNLTSKPGSLTGEYCWLGRRGQHILIRIGGGNANAEADCPLN